MIQVRYDSARRGTVRYSRRNSTGSPGRALHAFMVLLMLLLSVELYKGGEYACESL